jgi:long-chain acyl-CoA synthetase
MIISALHRHASNNPDSIAIFDGTNVLTYSELSNQVNQVSQWLTNEKVHSICFQLDNGINWVLLDLAAMQAGISSIPLPTFFTDVQVLHVLDSAGVDLFIPADHECPGSNWHFTATPVLTGLAGFRPESAAVNNANLSPVPRKITYTSGSTGAPKGVCLGLDTINTVTNSIVSAMESIEIRRHLCVLPLATLLENIAGLYAPIVKGIEVITPASKTLGLEGSSKLDVSRFASTLETYKPNSIILVPQLLMALTTLSELKMMSPSYLKMIAVGGGRISTQLLERAEASDLAVFEGYGLSECCSVLTLNRPGQKRKGSVGKPLPHAEIRVSPDGELEARGAVMSGYLGDSGTDSDWIGTGDLGHIDEDGYVYINGRSKNLFITSFGRNVNPEWIEAELTQQAAISQVMLYGEGQDHNFALIWLRFDIDREEIERLINDSNTRLPDYANVHEFILMEGELAEDLVTSNGRLRRGKITDHFQHIIDDHYSTNKSATGVKNAIL